MWQKAPSPSDRSPSGVSAVNFLVAFYDFHGIKAEVHFFCSVPNITRDNTILSQN
jgi:hypothetical protein